MKKVAFITGITGQDGHYLAKLLISKNYSVVGLIRDSLFSNLNFKYLNIFENIIFEKVDLLNIKDITALIEKYEPCEIYNLAAQSSVGYSFEVPTETLKFNIFSTLNLLDAIRLTSNNVKLYQASSSEMFGKISEKHLPLLEKNMFHPVSPYGISKAAAHWCAVNYRESYGVFASCGILFNHESVLRGNNFVTKKIIQSAIKISRGEKIKLTLGNLDVYRDWGYAPDYVHAMWLMLQQNEPLDLLICSGKAYSLESFVKETFNCLGLNYKDHIVIDKNLFRPNELKIIYGSNKKAEELLGWKYEKSFKQLIQTLVDDYKNYSKYFSNK